MISNRHCAVLGHFQSSFIFNLLSHGHQLSLGACSHLISLPQRFCRSCIHCRRLRFPWSDKTSVSANTHLSSHYSTIPRSQTKWCVHNKMAGDSAWSAQNLRLRYVDLHGRVSCSNLDTQTFLVHTVWLCFVSLSAGRDWWTTAM